MAHAPGVAAASPSNAECGVAGLVVIDFALIAQLGVIENRPTLFACGAAGTGRWGVDRAWAVVGAARPLILQLDERRYVTCHCTAVKRALP